IICLDDVGALGERMLRDGVPALSVNRRPGLDPRTAFRIARIVRERRLQVVHAHQYTPFFYGALGSKLAGVGARVIFTEHGRHWPDVVSARRRVGNRLLLTHFADAVTGVSEFSARALVERDGFAASRISIIENGVDTSRIADRTALLRERPHGLREGKRFVTCVARFHPVKDHATLLRAFAVACRTRDDVDLLLVGDGELRPALTRQVEASGLSGRVHFLGVRDDVPHILAWTRVFVLSSVSEAAPLTALEAMAAGVPVCLTDVGGNGEIVRNGVEGLLVPRGDADAMGQALGNLLDFPESAGAMGARGAARVRELYTLERAVDRYHRLYTDLAAGRCPPGA
ncbi:MAG: glycosyltransferase, partial [Vicinamibacterales bacterium]